MFTTRPDTIFGVSFMVLAPEHDYVDEITATENIAAVREYQKANLQQDPKENDKQRLKK